MMAVVFAALPWVLSVNTVVLTFLVGRKSVTGWVLGVCGQALWAAFILTRGEWGLAPMWVGLTAAYTWNLVAWLREGREQTDDTDDTVTDQGK